MERTSRVAIEPSAKQESLQEVAVLSLEPLGAPEDVQSFRSLWESI